MGVAARARCVSATSYTVETVVHRYSTDVDETASTTLGGGACGLTRIGGQLSSVLSPRLLKGIAGVGFLLIGLWTLLDLRAG